MDQFMRRAIELAAENVRHGGQPFGAVLVKDNEVVSEGVNELHKHFDVSGHAELIAIRKAQEEFQIDNLAEYTMYASGEPCPMCLTAMYFAGITDVYYCASVEDAREVGLGMSKVIYDDLRKPNEERQIRMNHVPLKESQENPMKIWKDSHANG